MLLTGTYRRTIDDKLRLALPKPLRDKLSEQPLFLTPGTDKSVFLYTETALEEIGQLLAQLSPAAKENRAFSRLFYAQAHAIELDKQGRMRFPPELASLANLESEVVVVGVRDRLEFWSADAWDEFLKAEQPSYDSLAEQVFADARTVAQATERKI